MMVMCRRAWDIRVLASGQVEPFHDAELCEQVERPKQRRPTDPQPPTPRGGLELGRGEVTVVFGDQVRDGTARAGQAVAAGVERSDDGIGSNHAETIPRISTDVENESH